MFVHGNASEDDAKDYMSIITKGLDATPLLESEKNAVRIVKFEDRSSVRYEFKGLNPNESNGCILTTYQVGSTTIVNSSMLYLLSTFMSEPAFDMLRTKEQLGYVVFTSTKVVENILYLQFIVQGDEKNPKVMDARVEAFIQEFRRILVEMDDDEYKLKVKGAIDKLLEKDKSLNEETNRIFNQISNGRYRFDRNVLEAEYLENVTREDCVRYYDRFIGKNGRSRAKLAVYCWGKTHVDDMGKTDEDDDDDEDVTIIKDGEEFEYKDTQCLWPPNGKVDFSQFM
jgi:secreted Zn-dependent insulinase-like peptidase